jgi:predicted dienelactone hydrolase
MSIARNLAVAIALACGELAMSAFAYDPMAVDESAPATSLDVSVVDAKRDREIPIRVYLPQVTDAAPVVLFSHGLGGSRENSSYLGEHWSRRGYAVVFMQHAGSDEEVWRGKPFPERLDALKAAMTTENFRARVADVPAVLDQFTAWNAEAGHALAGRFDLNHIGMCGHSFGAATTQAVAGQTFPLAGSAYTDKRIKAALIFSPNCPHRGITPADAFGSVTVPWMLMTGTRDMAPVGEQTVESRLEVFPALPPGSKYELVLEGAQHSAFGDRPLPGERLGRNPNHRLAILALGTAFWDAYLRDDAAARAWLDADGPRSILEENDRWQHK